MRITQPLLDEHLMISQGLSCMKRIRDRIEKDEHPPKAFFEKAIPFFMFYSDHCHHYKEEFLMFGTLAQKRNGSLDLEIGSLRHQHEDARELLTRIQRSLGGYGLGNEIAATSLLKNTAGFISVLSRHIFREERVFFPMAEAELTPEEKKDLMDRFKYEESRHNQWKSLKENTNLLTEMTALSMG